jgi:hypothetical protein
MHRSGTSMIADLLRSCGVDLGPERDLLPPAPSNPEGFWENRSFLRINEHILKALGGAWDRPPKMESVDWENDWEFSRLRAQAERLGRSFRGREPWGWKDPRNCLTIPFWRKIFPQMRVLVCVRNPLAIAESLHARDGFSRGESFELWLRYTKALVADAPPEIRVVTRSESYSCNPGAELRRVLTSLGIVAREDAVKRACTRVRPSLMHHHVTVDELVESGAPDDVIDCYLTLCGESVAMV